MRMSPDSILATSTQRGYWSSLHLDRYRRKHKIMYDQVSTQSYENRDGAFLHEVSDAKLRDTADRLIRSFTRFAEELEKKLALMLEALEAANATDSL